MSTEREALAVGLDDFVGLVRVPDTELMCATGCGCPHEEWDYRGATFAMHQDDGLPVTTVVLLDEDEELELPDAPTFEVAREQACRWIDPRLLPNVALIPGESPSA